MQRSALHLELSCSCWGKGMTACAVMQSGSRGWLSFAVRFLDVQTSHSVPERVQCFYYQSECNHRAIEALTLDIHKRHVAT